jgi:hypothetical protein
MSDHQEDDNDEGGCPNADQIAKVSDMYGSTSRRMDFFLMGLINTLVETLEARGSLAEGEFEAMLQKSIDRTPPDDLFGKTLKECFLRAGIDDIKPKSDLN